MIAKSLIPVALLASTARAQLRSFYIDCSADSPGNGTLEGPWNSLAPANDFTFGPGDALYLNSSVECKGMLSPRGSGNATHPILLSSYPVDSIKGPPIINANGANASVLLHNQDYWRVSKLALTNPGKTPGRRQGLLVQADDGRVHFNITVDRNTVYDVAGQTDKATYNSDFANSGGILLGAVNGSTYSGVWIRDNEVRDCGGGGIKIRPGQTGVLGGGIRVSHNRISAVGGDGIVVSYADSPLIDYNVAADLGKGKHPWTGGNFAGIWVMAAHNAVMRRNVVYGSAMSVYDSTAFDCDWGVSGYCLVEHNYSRDNAGGAFLDCDGCGVSAGTNQIVRYNIFENDCRIISVGDTAKLDFHNNVVYCADKDFSFDMPQTTRFTNNIFVGRANATLPLASGIEWDNNLFYGIDPPTGDGILADPMFVSPRRKGTTLGAGFGYKLLEGSPALGAGVIMDEPGTLDYFGNPVPTDRPGNIGPYAGEGLKR